MPKPYTKADLIFESAMAREKRPAPATLPSKKVALLLALTDLAAEERHPIDHNIVDLLHLDPDVADWLEEHPHALVEA